MSETDRDETGFPENHAPPFPSDTMDAAKVSVDETFIEDHTTPSVYDIIGKKVGFTTHGRMTDRSWHSLQNLVSIYRDKRYETFRYVLIDDTGIIKDHAAVTCKNPARSPVSPSDISREFFLLQIRERAAKHNCKIVILHNHPSGDVTESEEDTQVTKKIEAYFGSLFLGHVILDHGAYNVYTGAYKGWIQSTDTAVKASPDPLVNPHIKSYFNRFISGPSSLDWLASSLSADGGEKWNDTDWVPVVFLDSQHYTRGLHYFHTDEFSPGANHSFLVDKTVSIAQDIGAAQAIALPQNNDMFERVKAVNSDTLLFLDVLYDRYSMVKDQRVSGSLPLYFSTYSVSDSSFPLFAHAASHINAESRPFAASPAPAPEPPPSWPQDFPDVSCFIDETNDPKPWNILASHPDYDAAKNRGDRAAAARLVQDFMDRPRAQTELETLYRSYRDAVVVSVHAEEEHSRNRIPQAIAKYIGKALGFAVANDIVQSNKVVRTRKDSWYRFAFRPEFDGPVENGRSYILVDDVFSNGGSFSQLRQFIHRQGGRVVHCAAMTSGGHGRRIALSPQTELDLTAAYGIESLHSFCKEFNLYGGNFKALTEPEAYALLRAQTLDKARNRIIAARHEGVFSVLRRSVQGRETPLPAEGSGTPGEISPVSSPSPQPSGGPPAADQKDIHEWAKEAYPRYFDTYTKLQINMRKKYLFNETRINAMRKTLSDLNADFRDAYTMTVLKSFDKNEFETDVSRIASAGRFEQFHRNYLFCGATPALFTGIGYEEIPLLMPSTHVYSSVHTEGFLTEKHRYMPHYHGLGISLMNEIPDSLKDPLMIFASRNEKKYFSSLTMIDCKDSNNNPVFIGISPCGEGKLRILPIKANIITTVHSKDSYKNWIETHINEDKLLYLNGKEAAWAEKEFPSLPRHGWSAPGTARVDALQHPSHGDHAPITSAHQDSVHFSRSGFLTDTIQDYVQKVNSYFELKGRTDRLFVHESERQYNTPNNTHTEAVMSNSSIPSALKSASLPLNKHKMLLEYLETLTRFPDFASLKAHHEDFTRISDFRWLKNAVPEYAAMNFDAYKLLLDSIHHREAGDYQARTRLKEPPSARTTPLQKSLYGPGHAQPAPLTVQKFLEVSSSFSSPQDYDTYYDHCFPHTYAVKGSVKQVSPAKLALFDGSHELPAAMEKNSPEGWANLYSLANVNGINVNGIIPTPQEVYDHGIDVVKEAYEKLTDLCTVSYHSKEMQKNMRLTGESPASSVMDLPQSRHEEIKAFVKNPYVPGVHVPPLRPFETRLPPVHGRMGIPS